MYYWKQPKRTAILGCARLIMGCLEEEARAGKLMDLGYLERNKHEKKRAVKVYKNKNQLCVYCLHTRLACHALCLISSLFHLLIKVHFSFSLLWEAPSIQCARVCIGGERSEYQRLESDCGSKGPSSVSMQMSVCSLANTKPDYLASR